MVVYFSVLSVCSVDELVLKSDFILLILSKRKGLVLDLSVSSVYSVDKNDYRSLNSGYN